MTVSVTGPTNVTSTSPYTWTANPSGGVGHYTYRWTLFTTGIGQTNQVGTSQSVTLTPQPNWGIFRLTAYVSSAGSNEVNQVVVVNNSIPGGCRLSC